ncbi:hypothetical protein FA13DRAFT_834095 [Coprinellus micaceus]|uniref:Uncharacterized protein n=1 Tax=Coprinellus micaceus TaxID=71717 RepID=A0A4Y7S4H1_COPMI|nr:hypothetical protein FA13DRAFT_834095 [Coprinellus micaceus]
MGILSFFGLRPQARSKKTYTNHVAVFDIRLCSGQGTWAAVWETKEANWPNGEVDTSRVRISKPRTPYLFTPCPDARCLCRGSKLAQAHNLAVTTTSTTPRLRSKVVACELWACFQPDWGQLNGSSTLNTDNYGIPAASFPNTQCDISQFLRQHHIFIKVSVCGSIASFTTKSDKCISQVGTGPVVQLTARRVVLEPALVSPSPHSHFLKYFDACTQTS